MAHKVFGQFGQSRPTRRKTFLWIGLIATVSFLVTIICLNISSLSTFLSLPSKDHHGKGMLSLKSLESEVMNDRWIVITSISSPSTDIEILANISGWRVVVVGDLKTPTNWSHPGCSYLGVKTQQELGYQITQYLPYNSYTRKNIGYLYAIQHGAKYIYDTDDDNHPTNGEISFIESSTTSGLMYSGDNATNFMNPYAHFGQPTIWPRGYPLDHISKSNTNKYNLCTYKTPAIQQGVVNGDPDVDAIFRLTRQEPGSSSFNIKFDPRSPPVIIPEGTFAPFNSQNTHFAYDSFWALFLPSSVAFRVTDIWRGYWAQKLLWLLGHKIAFLPPNAIQIRNSHNYLADFKDEKQFYLETVQFIEFLKVWTCQKLTFFACVSQLSHDMAKSDFWDESDARLIDLWLSDLRKVGFREPRLENKTVINENGCLGGFEGERRSVYYSPIDANRPVNKGFQDLNVLFNEYLNYSILEVELMKRREMAPTIVFENILLVIVFNLPFFKNIPMLEALYRDHFPNMVYCGEAENYEKVKKSIRRSQFNWNSQVYDVSFINITMDRGFFGYECAIRAMEMNYKVDGYMLLGDDVLLNLWQVYQLNTKYSQLQATSNRYYCRYIDKEGIPWRCWRNGEQKETINFALRELEMIARSELNDRKTKSVKQCLKNRYELNLNMTTLAFGMSDFYYIPQPLADMFIDVMKVFLKHKVFLELAIPTAVTCLQPHSYFIESFTHESIWFDQRLEPFKYYKDSLHCFHPIKLSELIENKTLASEYSENYLTRLLEYW